MTAEADRGLWELTRLDGAVLVRFSCGGGISPAAVEQAFPGHLLFILAPTGTAILAVPAEEMGEGLSRLPGCGAETRSDISVIRAAGDGMSAADNRARRICARLAEDGIPILALSLSDIGAALAIDTIRADRAIELIRTAFLLPG